MHRGDALQVGAIGLGQTIAWASSTYLPAVVASAMALSLGIEASWIFAAYSCALAIMAILAPVVGRIIDRHGGQLVLCGSNLIQACGLVVLACSSSVGAMFSGWGIIGIGMALGLYDAAFAALVRQHGLAARRPITGITLVGGFASTVGWPLSSFLIANWDWQVACLTWAAAHLLIALPLNFFFIPNLSKIDTLNDEVGDAYEGKEERCRERNGNFMLLALFGAATAFVTSAMAAHLPLFLLSAGVGSSAAIAAAALLGPSQVMARLGEFIVAHKFQLDPLFTARVATALHPLAGILFVAVSGLPGAAMLFAILHGAGNGLITIAKGTLTLSIFGAQGYGVVQGKLAVAQRIMQALAPFAFSLVMTRCGAMAGLYLTVTLSLIALCALLGLKRQTDRARCM